MSIMTTVSELLDNHVTLTIESLDRIYLNGYIPSLQTAGQLVGFLTVHRRNPIPSPALLKKMDREFEASLSAFTEANNLVKVKFERNQRKDDVAALHRANFTGSEGVYLLGVAQEKCNSFRATTSHDENTNYVSVGFGRQPAFVSHYYYYLLDSDFGPAFIKVSTYAPYGLRICINGHEWAKRQLEKEGIAYEALDNGFKSCADPDRLQQICDSLGQKQILDFLDKWLAVLPLPLTNEDRAAGYNYLLSLWQIEVSRTQVFDVPVHGREFFQRTSTLAARIALASYSTARSLRPRLDHFEHACPRTGFIQAFTSNTSPATSNSTSKRTGGFVPKRPLTTPAISTSGSFSPTWRSCAQSGAI